MNQKVHFLEADVMEQAMANFLLTALDAKKKHKKIKINMETRRKLEIRREEQRLKKETEEYYFVMD